MRNKQIDLDNHLFAELERLGDESLSGDELKKEIGRAKAMCGIAAQINASRANSIKAMMAMDSATDPRASLPEGF